MTWVPDKIKRALGPDIVIDVGWTYRHLGLVDIGSEHWWIIHLNTGHGIAMMVGDPIEVMAVATEIAEATNWDFEGLTGWKNYDPDLPKKMGEIWARNPDVMPYDIPDESRRSEDTATKIAVSRLG